MRCSAKFPSIHIRQGPSIVIHRPIERSVCFSSLVKLLPFVNVCMFGSFTNFNSREILWAGSTGWAVFVDFDKFWNWLYLNMLFLCKGEWERLCLEVCMSVLSVSMYESRRRRCKIAIRVLMLQFFLLKISISPLQTPISNVIVYYLHLS